MPLTTLFLELTSGATVLKVDSPFEQWFDRRLEPCKHFLRLSEDLSNFREVYGGLLANDADAQ